MKFIETVKSLKWADFFIYVMTDPRALARQIRLNEPKSFLLSFLSPVLASLAYLIASSMTSGQSDYFYSKISYGWALMSILSILQILIYSSLTSFSLEFSGKKSSIKEIVTLCNFAQFPITFLLPLMFILSKLKFMPLYFMYMFIVLILLSIGFIIWSALISILGISEFYDLSISKSMFAYLFPYILISASGFIIFLLVIANLIGLAVG
jgi:hypothetical protein